MGAVMPVQRHNVVIPRQDGGVEVHPLKEWLRQHPDILPGMDPGMTTTHQLRNALRRVGWAMQETPTEIRLIKPGTDASPICYRCSGLDRAALMQTRRSSRLSISYETSLQPTWAQFP